jgi:hypothetical protein
LTYSSLSFRVTGVAPLIMRAAALANPLHPLTRKLNEIARKRLKTDADYEKISQIEWYGSLWIEDGNLVIPSEAVEGTWSVSPAARGWMGASNCPDVFSSGRCGD